MRIINKIKNNYSFLDKVRLAAYLIRTKAIDKKARIIRFPITIRGRKLISFNTGFTTGKYCRLEAFKTSGSKDNSPKIKFGTNVQMNDNVHICALESVDIGNDVLMASHIFISDCSHGCYKGCEEDSNPNISPINRPYLVSAVKIGDKTWIGDGSIIMPGVTIGKGCVIGAHSIVNKDIPDNSIAVGSPAKIIKQYSSEVGRWIKSI